MAGLRSSARPRRGSPRSWPKGLFDLLDGLERDIVVRYPSGEEMLEDVAQWRGTRIPEELPPRVRTADPPIDVRERIVYRLYRRA